MSQTLTDGTTKIFVWVNQIKPSEPKLLKDIRGQITADYQDYLDKEWIKNLKDKYSVKINEDVLSNIKK